MEACVVLLTDFHLGFQNLQGRIPWSDITDHPGHHLTKKSKPDADWRLEELSRMKSDAIDAWLSHWLKMQKLGRRPLVLRDGTGNLSDRRPVMAVKRNGKRKAQYIEVEEADPSDNPKSDGPDSDSDKGRSEKEDSDEEGENIEAERNERPEGLVRPHGIYPPSPKSAALSRQTRRTFLKSLSDEKSYHMLQLLFNVAKVGYILNLLANANLHCRTVIDSKETFHHGYRGPPTMPTFQKVFMTLSHHSPFVPLLSGLPPTLSRHLMARWPHTSKLNSLSSVSDWHLEAYGSPNSPITTLRFHHISLQVLILSLSINNSVTKSTIFSQDIPMRMLHISYSSFCCLCIFLPHCPHIGSPKLNQPYHPIR